MTELEQHELYEGDDVCLVRHAAECCLVIGVSIDSCATQVPQFLLPQKLSLGAKNPKDMT